MSITIMTAVWKNGPANSTQRFVLLALADNANDEGHCYPSLATIAKKCALSKRAVSYAIDQLEADGYLSRGHRFNEKGSPTSNSYHINSGRLTEGIAPRAIGVVNDVQYPGESGAIGVVNDVQYPIAPRAHKPSINHQLNHQREPVVVREMRASSPRLSPPLPAEPVYKSDQRTTAHGAATPKVTLTPEEIDTVNALVTVTGMGGSLNFDKLYPCAQALLAAGYTAAQVERHYGRQPAGFGDWNWYTNYWKGTKDGSMPRLADITETISGATNWRKTLSTVPKRIDPFDQLLQQQQEYSQ